MSRPAAASASATGGGSAASAVAGATGFPASSHAREWLWATPEALQPVRRRAQAKPRERLRRAALQAQREEAAGAKADAAAAAAAAAASGDTDMTRSPVAAPAALADAMMMSPAHLPTAAVAAQPKKSKGEASGPAEPLSLEEEAQLRLYYTLQLSQMTQTLRLPTHVSHAAITFFKRFYLIESVMEYSPKDILYCCLYLACKAEEHYLPLERMINDINRAGGKPVDAGAAASAPAVPAPSSASTASQPVQTVLSLEVPVLSVLKFQLRIYHLARASRGLLEEVKEMDPAGLSAGVLIHPDPALTVKGGQGTALSSIANFMLNRAAALAERIWADDDAIFVHSPAQIALAALWKAEEECRKWALDSATQAPLPAVKQGIVERYFLKNAPAGEMQKHARAKLDALLAVLNADAAASLDKKRLKAIERKRKAATNPLLDPASAGYEAARIEKEQEKERKRAEKKSKKADDRIARENALLLGTSPPRTRTVEAIDADDSDGFKLSKRQKSTPAESRVRAALDFTMTDSPAHQISRSPPPLRSAGLAAQFSDAME